MVWRFARSVLESAASGSPPQPWSGSRWGKAPGAAAHHFFDEPAKGGDTRGGFTAAEDLCAMNVPGSQVRQSAAALVFVLGRRPRIFAQSSSPDWAKGKFSANSASLRLIILKRLYG